MKAFLLVCLGGALGSGARYAVSFWVTNKALEQASTFPWGTLAVNLVGSFLLGLLMQSGHEAPEGTIPYPLQLTLGVGALGGFTTYSAFNYETLRYLEQGAWGTAATNVGLTLATCMAAGLAGVWVAKLLG